MSARQAAQSYYLYSFFAFMPLSFFAAKALSFFAHMVKISLQIFLVQFVRISVFRTDGFQPFMHFFLNVFISRISVDILHFMGILLKIIHFPLINVIIKVNQFAAVGSYAIMTLNH